MGSSVSRIVKKVTKIPRKVIKTVQKNPALLLAAVPFVAPAAFAGATGGLGTFATAAGRKAILTSALKRAAINAAAQKLAGGKVDLKGALISGGIGAAVPNIGPISGIQNDMLREAVTGGITSLGTQLARGQGVDLKQAALAGGISGGLQGLQNVQQGGEFFGGVDKTADQLPLYDEFEPISGAQPVAPLGQQAQIDADQLPLYDEFEPISGAQPVTPLAGGFEPSGGYGVDTEVTAKEFENPNLTTEKGLLESIKSGAAERYSGVSDIVEGVKTGDIKTAALGAVDLLRKPEISIGLPTLISYMMTPKPGEEEDEFDYAARKSKVGEFLRQYGSNFYSGAELDAFVSRNLSEYAYGGRVGAMGGGIMGVPIRDNGAGTMELDYRAKGGFVPVGVKEKADDVPAMLSKNEFVMTADAVRGAGNGDIERGAQKMYNTMKKLESRIS